MSSIHVRNSMKAKIESIILLNNWPVELISIDNERAKPPTSGNDWIVIEYIGSDEQQITTGAPGSNTFRETGDILIHYITKSATGAGTVYERLEFIRADIRATIINNIRIDGVNPPDSNDGATIEAARGNWWGASIQTSYEYDVRG